MADMLLTQNSTPIFQYIVWLLGKIMNYIFEFINLIGIPNIGLAIILFTIVMYLLLMPLTIKQQKFSKLSAKMNPEIQAIQAKYKGQRDQQSMMMMNQETQAVYKKYGVSPSGSCLQLLIQMPILFALYRVIYSMPAYVDKLRALFTGAKDSLVNLLVIKDWGVEGNPNIIEKLSSYAYYRGQFTPEAIEVVKANDGLISSSTIMSNNCIDVLNRASSADWNMVYDNFANNPTVLQSARECGEKLSQYNNFLGLNIGDSPSAIIGDAWASGAFLLVIGALLIPILAAVTQWINVKLAPQAQANANPNAGDTASAMTSSLKTMNMIMPIVSAIFCFTLPAGMGIYWIAGAVVRTVQQIVINKHIDKIDIEAMIKDNIDKYNEKRKAKGLPPAQLNNYANMNTKKVSGPKTTQQERDAAMKKSTEYYNQNAKPGSLAAKANMVKQYNEKNNK